MQCVWKEPLHVEMYVMGNDLNMCDEKYQPTSQEKDNIK